MYVTIECASQHILLPDFGGRKAPSSTGEIKTRRGSFGYAQDRLLDFAPQALCHAIKL
jgi:hypothetical protein